MNLAQLNFCCMECSRGCSNQEHTSIIDEWCDNVINELNRCVEQCRAKNSVVHNPTKGSVLWFEELKKLKQQSVDVHNLWKMCGKPRMGTINDERLRVKGLYKACINTHKRVLETRKREWLVYKLASGDGKGFWKGWRRIVNNNRNLKQDSISGIVNNEEICTKFKHVVEASFSDSWSAGWGYQKLNNTMSKLKEEFVNDECSEFTAQDIIEAIDELKIDKAAGFDNLKAESIKFAHPIIVNVLKELFNMCCKHGCVPLSFCVGRIVPVPKKERVYGKFTDYRPVTTVSVIAKVFVYCIVKRLYIYIKLHDLQFGFTKGVSVIKPC